jgi:uncharacterized protein
VVFVDTSAIYAFLASDDVGHSAAVAAWKRFMDETTPLFTSNYVVVESCALLQKRLGMGAVRSLLDALLPAIEVQWVTKEAHELAMTAMMAARRRKLSLVDCTSFVMMHATGCGEAFAFDKHFTEEGFRFPA